MNNEKITELREKILLGLSLAYKKLIQTKIKNNGYLVYSKDGSIVIKNVKDISN